MFEQLSSTIAWWAVELQNGAEIVSQSILHAWFRSMNILYTDAKGVKIKFFCHQKVSENFRRLIAFLRLMPLPTSKKKQISFSRKLLRSVVGVWCWECCRSTCWMKACCWLSSQCSVVHKFASVSAVSNHNCLERWLDSENDVYCNHSCMNLSLCGQKRVVFKHCKTLSFEIGLCSLHHLWPWILDNYQKSAVLGASDRGGSFVTSSHCDEVLSCEIHKTFNA